MLVRFIFTDQHSHYNNYCLFCPDYILNLRKIISYFYKPRGSIRFFLYFICRADPRCHRTDLIRSGRILCTIFSCHGAVSFCPSPAVLRSASGTGRTEIPLISTCSLIAITGAVRRSYGFHQIGSIGGYLNGHIRGFDLKALCIHYI